MARILLFWAIILLGVVFFKAYWAWYFTRQRKQSNHPFAGKSTMFDVREHIIRGEKELAIQTYCKIFQVGRQEAQRAVEELGKSIQQKDQQQD